MSTITEEVKPASDAAAKNSGGELAPQPQEITMGQAVDLLVQGVEMGCKSGAYTLQDAGVLAQAVSIVRKALSTAPKG